MTEIPADKVVSSVLSILTDARSQKSIALGEMPPGRISNQEGKTFFLDADGAAELE